MIIIKEKIKNSNVIKVKVDKVKDNKNIDRTNSKVDKVKDNENIDRTNSKVNTVKNNKNNRNMIRSVNIVKENNRNRNYNLNINKLRISSKVIIVKDSFNIMINFSLMFNQLNEFLTLIKFIYGCYYIAI